MKVIIGGCLGCRDIGKKSTSELSKQEEIPKRGEKFNVKNDL